MNQSWWRFPIFLRGRIRTKCSQLPPNSGETKRSVNHTVDFTLFYHLNLIKRNANLSGNAQDWAGLCLKKNANLSWFEWNFFEMLFISSGFLEKRNFMFQFCCKKKRRGGNSCPYLKRLLPRPPTASVGCCCLLLAVWCLFSGPTAAASLALAHLRRKWLFDLVRRVREALNFFFWKIFHRISQMTEIVF